MPVRKGEAQRASLCANIKNRETLCLFLLDSLQEIKIHVFLTRYLKHSGIILNLLSISMQSLLACWYPLCVCACACVCVCVCVCWLIQTYCVFVCVCLCVGWLVLFPCPLPLSTCTFPPQPSVFHLSILAYLLSSPSPCSIKLLSPSYGFLLIVLPVSALTFT